MEKLLTKEIAIQMLDSKEESLKALALYYYPELGKKVGEYEHACELIGINTEPTANAFTKLSIITKAYNSFYEGEDKFPIYYPVFERDEAGIVQVFDDVYGWGTHTGVPVSLLFFSEDDCKEAVENNLDLYKELYSYQ